MRDCSKEQSGYQMLSFNAGCTHLLLLYSPYMPLPLTPPPPPPLSWFVLQYLFEAARTTLIIFINSLSLFAFFVSMNE